MMILVIPWIPGTEPPWIPPPVVSVAPLSVSVIPVPPFISKLFKTSPSCWICTSNSISKYFWQSDFENIWLYCNSLKYLIDKLNRTRESFQPFLPVLICIIDIFRTGRFFSRSWPWPTSLSWFWWLPPLWWSKYAKKSINSTHFGY